MKKFVFKIFMGCVFLWAAAFFTEMVFARFQISAYVYQAIKDVQNNSAATKLILGDSTGDMLFRDEKTKRNHTGSSECIATTNYGVTPLGQWLLMKEFCETRSHLDSLQIHLILHPGSFSATFHSKYTYHYFHLPFSDLIQKYSSCADHYPEDFIAIQKIIRIIPPLRITRHNPTRCRKGQSLSMASPTQLTICALNRIKELEKEYPVKIRIVPPPLHEDWKERDISSIGELLRQSKLIKQAEEYEDSIEFWTDSEEWKDDAHFYSKSSIAPNNWLDLLD